MTKPLSFTQASIKRAIAGAEAAGKRVLAIRADGIIIVDNGESPHPLIPSAQPSEEDWDAEA